MKSRTIKRARFEAAGWRIIPLACGAVKFPDGTESRFNVRLQAKPGTDGDIVLIAEDIGSGRTIRLPLKRTSSNA